MLLKTSAFLVGENHGLQHIDHLCDVGHLHTVGILMEQTAAFRSMSTRRSSR